MLNTDITEKLKTHRATFAAGTTRTLSWRREQLQGLRNLIDEHAEDIHKALKQDLGKPALEAKVSETDYTKAEIKHALKNLKKWTKPEKRRLPVRLRPGKAYLKKEPYGVALIIGPWNFPFQLIAAPLVSALAAGNCVVLKPSEIAPATSDLITELMPKYLDTHAVTVIPGDAETAKNLLVQRFDYIFYTGSSSIGREIMAAAAHNLTPVTLELGGKSPCIVDASADIDVAARRIVWGKFLNAGQTCVAPDYVLVDKSIEDKLLEQIRTTVYRFYGDNPQESPDYGRIVNTRHFDRLLRLLDSGETVIGGQNDRDDLFISPTVLCNVDNSAAVMQEEIFGPVLPVLSINDIPEAINFVRQKPKPLALYLFTSSKAKKQEVLQNCSSGGVCINDTIMQLSVPELPFGGIGESGMGRYHGKAGFDTFSNPKTVLDHGTRIDSHLRYPPYQ